MKTASVDSDKPLADPYQDISIIQEVVQSEFAKGRDVILACHRRGTAWPTVAAKRSADAHSFTAMAAFPVLMHAKDC